MTKELTGPTKVTVTEFAVVVWPDSEFTVFVVHGDTDVPTPAICDPCPLLVNVAALVM